MQIYQGIQFVFVHVRQLISSISNWFTDIQWSSVIEQMPLQFQATIAAAFLVVLAMCAIGLVKKLSFLLG